MPLSSKDISLILNLLYEDTCGSLLTFEQISQQFQQGISKSDYLHVGNALILLLQNRDLTPTSQQRLIIFYLFIIMYPNEQSSMDMNPFAPVFLSVLQTNAENSSSTQKHFHWMIPPVTSQERSFVTLLLHNRTNDVLTRTPNQILQFVLTFNSNREENESEKQLQEKLHERKQQWPVRVQCHLPAVINDPEINNYTFDTLIGGSHHHFHDSRQTIEDLLANNAMERTIRPEYLRLVPPLHEFTIDELVWLTSIDNDPPLLIWDASMCATSSIPQEMRKLMDRAYRGLLNLQQQQKLLDELNQNPDLVHHIGLIPSKLPLLVNNSPSISVQCLLNLISSDKIADYLAELATMKTSVHSMEVVNRLSTSMALPQDFLHLYISTCLKTCDATKDKYVLNRFVRLVSVFIQSLIRNKVIDIKDLFLEVQGFCIHFRLIKEASSLFQLLQTLGLHSDETDDPSTSSTTHED